MRIFIEQSGEKRKRNIFNKETGVYERTVDFHVTYPYAYGYILGTLASDGGELDCYVITNKKLEACSIIEGEPIGMVEYFEDDQPDHKILISLKGEDFKVDAEVKTKLLDFNARYYQDQPNRNTRVGNFLGKEEAVKEIEKSSALAQGSN
ncbi:MAG: inorganic diphosphatase [Patescibacteria group bacterium]